MNFIRAHRTLIIILVVLVLVGGIGFYYWYTHRESPLTFNGNVDIRQVSLTFNATEHIDSINVEEGDTVKKGQVLAKLNTRPLELNIAQCKAQIAQQQAVLAKAVNGSRSEDINSAEASMNEAKAKADNALTYFNRIQQLYQGGAVSKQDFDNAESDYKSAAESYNNLKAVYEKAVNGSRAEDIAAEKASLEALQEQLKIYEYNLSQATLIAPQDGVIRSRLLEVGDMASPSTPVLLMGLNNLKWVRIYVPETQLANIHEGQKGTVTIDSSSQTMEGQVGYISDTAEFTPKNVETTELRTALLYEVRVYVTDPDNLLRMGMPATVSF
jgi:HlyD family secretion protein